MFRFWQQSKPGKQKMKETVPDKKRTPIVGTNDPYLVRIVRLLEQLRSQKKH